MNVLRTQRIWKGQKPNSESRGFWAVQACAPGSFSQILEDLSGVTYVCVPCSAGSSQSSGASQSCTPCPAGDRLAIKHGSKKWDQNDMNPTNPYKSNNLLPSFTLVFLGFEPFTDRHLCAVFRQVNTTTRLEARFARAALRDIIRTVWLVQLQVDVWCGLLDLTPQKWMVQLQPKQKIAGLLEVKKARTSMANWPASNVRTPPVLRESVAWHELVAKSKHQKHQLAGLLRRIVKR